METSIQNLDDQAFQALAKRARAEGRDVSELLNEAMRTYLARPTTKQAGATLRDLKPERFPEGNERLSEEIDSLVYGHKRS